MNIVAGIAIGALPILLIIWISALADLMRRRDAEFPGKNDKLAWVFILLLTGLVGAIVYFCCRPRQVSDVVIDAQPTSGSESEPISCLDCGQPIPPGSSKCGSCGWSYSDS